MEGSFRKTTSLPPLWKPKPPSAGCPCSAGTGARNGKSLNAADQKSRAKHQDQWLGKVASFVMRQSHQLWMLRNNERHGVTPAEKETRIRITVERELDHVYAKRLSCELCHQAIFYDAIFLHKKQPLLELRNWLSMYSVLIKISCKRRLEADLLLAVT
jgi:hypothetical protein